MQAREESVEIGALPVRFLEVNGASLAFVEKGEGDAVVFVHGPVCDLRIWLTQVELFSGKYRAVTYSRRTHWPAKDAKDTALYSRSSHAEDLICFLEALKLKKTHIVGHSYGGAVSLLAAIQRPDLIASLTLAEPSPFLGLFSNSDLDLVSRQKIG
ncbi:MAG TPA: alpha/beta hydrolase, partial [Pyrinomonadaceae bacterium]|nr:alpha/beta hydrolase [Pyrinomonadaceae bacterium]